MEKDYKELFLECYGYFHDESHPWKYTEEKQKAQYKIIFEHNAVYILFQETEGLSDWLKNLFFFAKRVVPYKDMQYPFKVHGGFWEQFNSVRDEILVAVQDYVQNEGAEHIYIYGWSLGGALATLCHEMMSFNFTIKPQAITIGAPRVFCKTEYWNNISSRFEKYRRYRNESDVVSVVPFKFLGLSTPFNHVSPVTQVGREFKWYKVFATGTWHLDIEYYNNIIR